MKREYDYIIVGSGLFGSVFAFEAKKKGKKVLVLEKRNHLGGNVYNENIEGINVHTYGAHIFHTNDKAIWDFVNQFSTFNNFINSPIANYKGDLYNLPFNMNTFYQIWGTKTPDEAQKKLKIEQEKYKVTNPSNLEEQAINLVGKEIYEILIKGYTEKQWGRPARELPRSIIKRIPVRFDFNNNYFNDKFQGIPEGGYNKIINGLLEGIEIKCNTDFLRDRDFWFQKCEKIIFTGKIDEFFNYKLGELQYRSLEFRNEFHENVDNYQGNAVVNYTDRKVPYTRILEHKHFEFGKQKGTLITQEFPIEWNKGKEAYYPINDQKNNILFSEYKNLSAKEQNVIFGGRLAEYKYYDMHQVIASALKVSKLELKG